MDNASLFSALVSFACYYYAYRLTNYGSEKLTEEETNSEVAFYTLFGIVTMIISFL
jgi:tellurite resistance protein TehA-like permease